MKNKLSFKNISVKIFISTAGLSLLSIFIISLSLFNKYSESLLEHSSEKAQQIIELSAINIESYLDDLYRLSLSPYYNQDVMDALDKDIQDSDLISLYRTRTIEDFLEQILIIPRQDILRVFILTTEIYKGERIPSSIDTSQDYKKYDWYKKAIKTEEPLLVSAHVEQLIKNPQNVVFSIVTLLRSTRNTDKILGVIKVDANYSSIKNLCDQADFGKDGGLFIIDSTKQIIYSNMSSFNTDAFRLIYDTTETTNPSVHTMTIDDYSYLINWVKVKDSDWTMVGVTSYNTINSKILTIKKTANIIAVTCFIGSIFIIFLYLHKFLHPLNDIIKSIHKIEGGNLDVVFPITSKDELAYLSNSLNDMVIELRSMFNENNRLVHQIYEAEYLQKEAQINYLFSQIQPHFIYNTLNMISMLIQTSQYESAVNTINKLSIMLRGLSNLDKDIPVITEIEFLEAYLSIQKSRYVDRLDYEINIDSNVYQYVIPALILQPIVENSVIHGCEESKETTTISISSKSNESNHLYLIIKDDGRGMSNETLTTLKCKLGKDYQPTTKFNSKVKGSGIALLNVNKRIQIKYGNNYGLNIESTENIGTTVTINLPKQLS